MLNPRVLVLASLLGLAASFDAPAQLRPQPAAELSGSAATRASIGPQYLGLCRQLPAGTEGAYRLMANLLSLGRAQ